MQTDCDVIVIGAGFSGLYAVHKLRDELGLRVQGFDREARGGGLMGLIGMTDANTRMKYAVSGPCIQN